MTSETELREECEKQWQQWLEGLSEAGLNPPSGSEFREALLQVWEASDYVAQASIRHPELLLGLYEQGELDRAYAEQEMAAKLSQALESIGDEAALLVAL